MQQQRHYQEHIPPPPAEPQPLAAPSPSPRPPVSGSQTHRVMGVVAATPAYAPLTPRAGADAHSYSRAPRTPRSLLRVMQPVAVECVIMIKWAGIRHLFARFLKC
jgi:hypothetical protein